MKSLTVKRKRDATAIVKPTYQALEQKGNPEDQWPDWVYYNLSLTGNTSSTPILADFSQQLNQPLLPKASAYRLAITRYSVPISTLPICYFPSNTHYISMVYNGSTYNQVVTLSTQDSSSSNSLWTYGQGIQSFNNALSACFQQVKAGSASGFTQATLPPVLVFSPTTQLITLYAQTGVWRPDNATGIALYFNTPLFSQFLPMFDNFQNSINSANYCDNQILIKNTNTNGYTSTLNTPCYVATSLVAGTPTTSISITAATVAITTGQQLTLVSGAVQQIVYASAPVSIGGTTLTVTSFTPSYAFPVGSAISTIFTAYAMVESAVSVSSWSALSRLMFMTRDLPIRTEFVPASTLPGNGGQTGATSANPCVTDFQITQSEYISNPECIQYSANGNLRWCDMISDAPINRIGLYVRWVDKQNNDYALSLGYGECLNVKLAFKKKTVIDV